MNKLNLISKQFTDVVKYDGLTVQLTTTSKVPRTDDVDISGWGAQYTKSGVSFNAIRMPAGVGYSGSVPANRKWSYAQICIKQAETDSNFIAVSPLVKIEGLLRLPELIFPLVTPDTSSSITLNDASFTGSTYFINIYFYNAILDFAYGGCVTGTFPNYLVGSSRYTKTNNRSTWFNFTGNPPIVWEHLLLSGAQLYAHNSELETFNAAEIILPDKINAIVGDTLQLFWRGIIKAVNPYQYDIISNFVSPRSAWYPRYFEYIPTSSDIGTANLIIKLKNSNGIELASKLCSIVTRAAVKQPAANKNILCIGDSLTNYRVYPVEANRRLTGTGGSPAGLSYSNIQFVGRKKAGSVGVEGNAGWGWPEYLTVGRKAYTFTVSGVTVQPTVEAVYQDANGKQYTMWWDYSATSLKFSVNDLSSTPPSSGILTKISGTGDASITYSAAVQSSANPFWNDSTNALDFASYVNKWCGGSVDVIYVLMTWNGQYGNRIDFSDFTNAAKTLFTHIKAAYPSVAIKLMGVQVSDLKGGVRVDGYPQENTYRDTYGLAVTALNMNKAYQALANDPAYSSYVEFVHVSSQVDSEYNMPFLPKAVNTRNSAYTEMIGTNDVHPGNEGYYQIADVIFRNFVANYCQ